jgi:hypothetical protein
MSCGKTVTFRYFRVVGLRTEKWFKYVCVPEPVLNHFSSVGVKKEGLGSQSRFLAFVLKFFFSFFTDAVDTPSKSLGKGCVCDDEAHFIVHAR